MEAVPRLHMLWFVLKTSPEGTSFANLKKYIAEFYQEDADSYSKEVFALETLRNQAMHPTKDKCAILKRYYCQLHSLQNRFPQLAERGMFTFTWKDLYQNNVNEVTDLRYELAAVLFNIAASHTQVGASVTRGDVDGMKLACTHFQCAAWAFGELRERYANVNSGGDFMTTELLVFMQQVSFAQAQECILEKSLIDNRKPNIVAKVTAQIVVYYGAALAALLTGGDDGPLAQVVDSSVYKLWKKYVRFKISYLNCILYLYQGQHAEEQQKMGERVTLYQAAWEKLEEARKESKGLPDQKEINESLIFTADVVEAKRKNAKNENEFIYHEAIPELTTISAVQGANLVNGTSFSVTDPEVAGDDIFARLVPMKAHEASSLYSEEKAKLLRKYGAHIEEKDAELASFMSSLTLDSLNVSEEKANKIPQGIVDRCAALNANKTAIPDLIAAMSQLAEICADVEMNLKEITTILAEEERQESEFQQKTGVQRTQNAHITELTREFQKYTEAHARAGESNDTLRKAMELHVNNLKILARPLQDIQQSVPKLSTELNTAEIFKDVKLILNKANEMKAQRAQFHADLRIAVNEDDITAKVIAYGKEEGLQLLFERELAKHERLSQLIDQNLLAQKNILQALTEAYAKAAPVLKTLTDVKHKRESFFSSLAASYDVYEDLLAKSAKGLEFYKKLSGNVQKLLTRFKSAHDVQAEERQQRLKNVTNTKQLNAINSASTGMSKDPSVAALQGASTTNAPKLRDYLKSKNTSAASIANAAGFSDGGTNSATLSSPYIPPIRPNPLGSENPTQAVCSSGAYYPHSINTSSTAQVVAPNEPPPPYSLQQTQYYDPTAAGYTNPMYQQQQQNIAPPAYKLQASPNSQFSNLNTNTCNVSPQTAAYNMGVPIPQQALQQQAQQQQQQALQQQAQQQQQLAALANNSQQASNIYAAANMQQQASNFNYTANTGSYMPTSAAPVAEALHMTSAAATSLPYAYSAQAAAMQYITATQAQAPGSSSARVVGGNAPLQSTYAPQMNMNPQQSQSGVTANYPTPATLPLYVATTPSDAMSMSTTTPPSLQAPYVVNAVQQPQQLQQQNKAVEPVQQYGIMASNAATVVTPAVSSVTNGATAAATVAVNMAPADIASAYSPYSATTKHPGYSFNPQTGVYEYGSGYQQGAVLNKQFYGQYTSARAMQQSPVVGTTDSETANKINLATGFDSPIISHTKSPAAPNVNDLKNEKQSANVSYYTPPYGYQSHDTTNAYDAYNATQMQQQQSQQQYAIQPQQQPQPQQQLHQQPQPQHHQPQPQQSHQEQQTFYQQERHSIYMQSGGASIAPTQTTKSAAEYAFSAQQMQPAGPATPTPPNAATTGTTNAPTASEPHPAKTMSQPLKKSSNIDLLTDIDFSGAGVNVPPPILPAPSLKPEIISSPPASHVGGVRDEPQEKSGEASPQKHPSTVTSAVATIVPPAAPPQSPPLPLQIASPVDSPAAHKSSFDNLSICSDLSSLDNNFDWDSVSLRNEQTLQQHQADKHSNASTTFLLKPVDPFNDDKTLKYFHKEVERYEKIIESLNIKMLNGHTQLSAKWKELHDLLAKETTKRTTTIAKLFPEKNRALDCLPYDHARVKLEKNTDDYINAAYVKNLGPGCPNFIIAQTPQQNTITDFWSMIWSQKSRTVACLHTPNEMLDPFWPQEQNIETQFDDFTVKCVKINSLSHCMEYNLKLSMHGADAILDLSILQIKAWTKSSPSQIIGIARNALQAHQQRCLEFNTSASPLILNCLTGSERSELIAIAICAILATQIARPVLINVIDIWHRICAQRQNALRDTDTLEQSMQIALNHAHDVLNKRGIMTSYQMKIAPQIASKEKEEIKDPLNELDPLWKLK